MKKYSAIPGAALLALVATSLPAEAQDNTSSKPTPKPEEVVQMETFYVSGLKASLITAQETKRENISVVDSIVADDIGKFPDLNVTDALQRISGIQVTRDLGEGGSVAIRGLTQMETLLNGRELFTGTGRGVNFQDLPAELVAGLDVYKTPSADQLEGGLGGTIDVRTRKPFDFKGRQISANTKIVYGELVDETKPQFSGLFSDTWNTKIGKIGALVAATHQQRAFRQDQMSLGSPIARTDIAAGETVYAPNGVYLPILVGYRNRTGLNTAFQWKPTHDLSVFVEANKSAFKTNQDTWGNSFTAGTAATSYTLFPKTSDLQSVTWQNSSFTAMAFARDSRDQVRDIAAGAEWNHENLTISADLNYTDSSNSLFFSGLNMSAKTPTLTQSIGGTIPSALTSGITLTDPANFNFSSISCTMNESKGDQLASTLNATYRFSNIFLKSLKAGFRFAEHTAKYNTLSSSPSLSGKAASAYPAYYAIAPVDDFFPAASGVPVSRNFLTANIDQLRDYLGVRNTFGVTSAFPAANPLSLYKITEKTSTGYLMANYDARVGIRVDGNIGMRVTGTDESLSSSKKSSTGVITPNNLKNSYLDALPSMNTRLHLTEDTVLRFAASKNLTRPSFGDLKPSLSLTINPTNPLQNSGSGGNPELKPMRADQCDISLEKYFSKSTSVYLAGFYKDISGATLSVSAPEVHDGVTYYVSRPRNTNKAKVKGFEVGYQQFYDFLPGWLSGFGTQMNYTYVDSTSDSSIAGLTTPLANLSRNSCNVVLMYEMKKVSARLAYNWRDKYFRSIASYVGVGLLPIYNEAYGWLDASVSYHITDNIKVSLEGTNLLNTIRKGYYGTTTRRADYIQDDRQVIVSCSIKL